MTTRARVALIRTTPATVLDDYARTMDTAAFHQHLDAAATTILRISITRRFPFPGANTTPWQLEGTIRALQAAGYRHLVYQPVAPPLCPSGGPDVNGYAALFEAYGIRPANIQPIPSNGGGPFLERGFWHTIQILAALAGKQIVLLPALHTTITPMMPYLMGAGWHQACLRNHELFVSLLRIQRELQIRIFTIADGTTISAGPSAAVPPEIKNIIVASADPIAVAAVAAKLSGCDPIRDLPHVRLAHEQGLGVGDLREIELVRDDNLVEGQRWTPAGCCSQRTGPFGALAPLGSIFDYYRWTGGDRRVLASWVRHTGWGRLFQQYQQRGRP